MKRQIVMHTRIGKYALSATLILFWTTQALAGSRIERSYEEIIDLEGITHVEIDIFKGHIEARGEDRNNADLHIMHIFKSVSESEADELEQSIHRNIRIDGDTLYIDIEYEKEQSWLDSVFGKRNPTGLKLEIQLPKEMNISLETSGGHLSAKDFEGEVSLETSGGRIEAENVVGDLTADTSGGNISISRIDGNAYVKTSGGRINARSITGDARLRTSGGSIEADMIEGHLEARTSGGNIKAALPNGIDADTTLKTSGGNVSVKLPKGASFTLDASTHAGRISSDFAIPIKKRIPGGKAKTDVNDGGPILRLKTSGGNISINRL